MAERRHQRRRVLSIHFNCYLDGERFDSESLDISPRGALLITRARVPIGKRILIVPTGQPDLPDARTDTGDPATDLPVLLSAQVVRWNDAPSGLGIQWVSGISHVGIDPLLVVIQYILGRSAATLTPPEPAVLQKQNVSYDFLDECFRLLDAPYYLSDSVVHAAPSPEVGVAMDPGTNQGPITHPVHPPPWIQKTRDAMVDDFAPLPTSHGFESNAASGQLTDLLSEGSARVQVMKRVRADVGDREVGAIIHNIGLTSLLLIIPGEELVGLERLSVILPVPYRTDRVEVLLRCTVTRSIPLPEQGATGYKLWILNIEGEAVPDLYERYVKYLFEKSLFKQG